MLVSTASEQRRQPPRSQRQQKVKAGVQQRRQQQRHRSTSRTPTTTGLPLVLVAAALLLAVLSTTAPVAAYVLDCPANSTCPMSDVDNLYDTTNSSFPFNLTLGGHWDSCTAGKMNDEHREVIIRSSANNPAVISCGGGKRAFDIAKSDSVTLEGLTISGASDISTVGGAVRITKTPNVVVIGCVFHSNSFPVGSASAIGGGLYVNGVNNDEPFLGVYTTTVSISNSTFLNNTASSGGGLYLDGNGPEGTLYYTIEGCTFASNTAQPTTTNNLGAGGGLMFVEPTVGSITRTTFVGNHARFGGGVRGLSNCDECEFVNNTVSFEDTKNVFHGGAGAVITEHDSVVTNSWFAGNRVISPAYGLPNGYGGALFLVAGTGDELTSLSLENCNFTANTAGKGAAVSADGNEEEFVSVTATNCNFTRNSAANGIAIDETSHGGAVSVHAYGFLHLSQSTLYANDGGGKGGAIFVGTTTTATLTDLLLLWNAADIGGGVASQDSTTLTVSNVRFAHNAAVAHGGALSCFNNVSLTIEYVTFVNNTVGVVPYKLDEQEARGDGAGLAVLSTFTLNAGLGVSFTGNSAAHSGGGIYVRADAAGSDPDVVSDRLVALASATITNNTAAFGGGIYSETGLELTDVVLTNNVAIVGGGAFLSGSVIVLNGDPIFGVKAFALRALTIAGNRAEALGGGLYLANSDVTATELTLTGNTVDSGSGGGIHAETTYYLVSLSSLNITNSVFDDNVATESGGCVSVGQYRSATLDNVTMTGCSASDGSGGGTALNAVNVAVADTRVEGCSASLHGGAVWLGMNVAASQWSNVVVSANSAARGSGGGFYALFEAELDFDADNTRVLDNYAGGFGGGVAAALPTAPIEDAPYAAVNRSVVSLTSCVVRGNTAGGLGSGSGGGGGLSLDAAVLRATDSHLTNNTCASCDGGAVHFNSGLAQLSGGSVTGNLGTIGGGLFFARPGELACMAWLDGDGPSVAAAAQPSACNSTTGSGSCPGGGAVGGAAGSTPDFAGNTATVYGRDVATTAAAVGVRSVPAEPVEPGELFSVAVDVVDWFGCLVDGDNVVVAIEPELGCSPVSAASLGVATGCGATGTGCGPSGTVEFVGQTRVAVADSVATFENVALSPSSRSAVNLNMNLSFSHTPGYTTTALSTGATVALVQCDPGEYLKEGPSGRFSCAACGVGSFSPCGTLDECASCLAGTFGPEEGLAECEACPPGYFTGTTGQVSCTPCSPGFYAPQNNSFECTECPRGTFNLDSAKSECKPCKRPAYTITEGSITCQFCTEGLYSPAADEKCIRCNVTGSTCASGEVVAAEGYYLFDESEPYHFGECPVARACPGGAGKRCLENRRGELCAECKEDYVLSGSECVECTGFNPGVFITMMLVFAVFATYAVFIQEANRGTVKILTFFGQTMAVLVQDSVSLPIVVKSLWLLASLSFEVIPQTCLAPLDFYERFAVSLATPFIALAAVLAVYVCEKYVYQPCCKSRGATCCGCCPSAVEDFYERHKDPSSKRQRYRKAYFSALLFTFTPAMRAVLSLMNCRPVYPDAAKRVLIADPAVVCTDWDGVPDPTYRAFWIAGIILLIFYVYALPVGLFGFMFFLRRRADLSSDDIRARYAILYYPYKPWLYWWEALTQSRKAIVVSIWAFTATTQLKNVLLSGFFFLLACVQLIVQPYRADADNALELLLLLVLLASSMVLSSAWWWDLREHLTIDSLNAGPASAAPILFFVVLPILIAFGGVLQPYLGSLIRRLPCFVKDGDNDSEGEAEDAVVFNEVDDAGIMLPTVVGQTMFMSLEADNESKYDGTSDDDDDFSGGGDDSSITHNPVHGDAELFQTQRTVGQRDSNADPSDAYLATRKGSDWDRGSDPAAFLVTHKGERSNSSADHEKYLATRVGMQGEFEEPDPDAMLATQKGVTDGGRRVSYGTDGFLVTRVGSGDYDNQFATRRSASDSNAPGVDNLKTLNGNDDNATNPDLMTRRSGSSSSAPGVDNLRTLNGPHGSSPLARGGSAASGTTSPGSSGEFLQTVVGGESPMATRRSHSGSDATLPQEALATMNGQTPSSPLARRSNGAGSGFVGETMLATQRDSAFMAGGYDEDSMATARSSVGDYRDLAGGPPSPGGRAAAVGGDTFATQRSSTLGMEAHNFVTVTGNAMPPPPSPDMLQTQRSESMPPPPSAEMLQTLNGNGSGGGSDDALQTQRGD